MNTDAAKKRTYDECFLKNIKDTIDRMSVSNHVEILRILMDSEINLNENQYGVHVNLSDLDSNMLDNIVMYTHYVESQKKEFSVIENIKDNYKRDFFVVK